MVVLGQPQLLGG